jgi:hypothetical protein
MEGSSRVSLWVFEEPSLIYFSTVVQMKEPALEALPQGQIEGRKSGIELAKRTS